MSYKTILVHVDRSRHAASRYRVATAIALAHDAHLIGTAMAGLPRFLYADSGFDLSHSIIASELDLLYAQSNQALAAFEAIAASASVRSFESRVVSDDAAAGLALQARYADLVVLSQVDQNDSVARLNADVPAHVMLNCARPVLLVPYAGEFSGIGTHALIAWDGSLEAARAVADAVGLLRQASKVTIALFNPETEHGEQPGAALALYLARHGIGCEVLCQRTEIDVGDALLSTAADLHAGLIVMGGYGHSRFRELLLGGVTDTLLKTMTVPVLMSH